MRVTKNFLARYARGSGYFIARYARGLGSYAVQGAATRPCAMARAMARATRVWVPGTYT